jgi:tRNA 2-thiouridine synthesizing protein A
MKPSSAGPAQPAGFLPVRTAPGTGAEVVALHVDTRGTRCPTPLLRLRKALRRCEPGQVLELSTDDPAAFADIPCALAELPAQLFAERDEGACRVFVILRC